MPAAIFIVMLAATVAATAAATATAQTQNNPALATIISPDGLNLRSSPSTSAAVLLVVPFATVVTLNGSPTSDRWYSVSFGPFGGWASGDYLAAGSLDPVTARAATTLSGVNPSRSAAPAPGSVLTGLPQALPALVGSPPAPPAGGPGFAAGPPGWTTSYQATASYYGIDDGAVTGTMMACGSPFDPMNSHAAATNDWPCGTRLRVATADGRNVEVVVTDHGQYPQHWIDLTYAAFAQLAEHKAGVLQVSVQPAH